MRTDIEVVSLETAMLQRAHRLMFAMRLFEERIQSNASRGAIRGSTHLAIGQEAVAAGLRLATDEGDFVAPTYRSHGWSIAWGLELHSAFAEMFGRDTGSNRGRGGSKHFSSRQLGIIPANAIVAAALPIAAGVAWQAKRTGSDRLAVVPFGDGATNQAVFHEALHLARIWKLPVLFVCENNLYSEMTPIADMTPFVDMAQRAAGYDMPAVIVDGMDVAAVAAGVTDAVGRARAGEGPTFIEAKTYRFCGHMPGDTEPYRTPEEVSAWMERDPLALVRAALLDRGFSPDDLEAVEAEVTAQVDDAEQLALADREPTLDDIRLGVSPWMETTR
jgi:acetoin:2,6-dichlorophenolindophenol oxidoreductase subunit alpha